MKLIWIITTIKYCNYTEAREISPVDQHLHISTDLSHYYLCHSYSYTPSIFRPAVWCCHWVGSSPCWKDQTAFFYRVKQSVLQSFLNCMTLQMKAPRSFKMPETTCPTAHITSNMTWICSDTSVTILNLAPTHCVLMRSDNHTMPSTATSAATLTTHGTSYLQWPQHKTR